MNMSAIEIVKQVPLTPEQVESVGGGMCQADQWYSMVQKLTGAYEELVHFATHVIGRVAGDPE
jgi:hypothetical protein